MNKYTGNDHYLDNGVFKNKLGIQNTSPDEKSKSSSQPPRGRGTRRVTIAYSCSCLGTGFDLLVYNGESSRLVMGFLKLLLPEEGPSRSLGTSQQGGVTDNTVDIGFARRSGRDCRNPEAMEGSLHSPPCVLDTGNPCRYDGCVNSIGRYRIRATTSIKTYSVFYIY